MDILHLIDRLEAMVMDSPRVPVVGKVLLDPQDLLDLVDSMRLAVPESVKEVERMRGRAPAPSIRTPVAIPPPSRDLRVRGAPDAESMRLIELTEQECEAMIEEARRRAEAALTEAENQAAEIRAGADEYALEVLARLEQQLTTMVTTVQRGIDQLEHSRGGR